MWLVRVALERPYTFVVLALLVLAVGILVDDATVTIENIERHLEEGAGLKDAILQDAAQIAIPALVSTLCICIVFLPMFFLGGVAHHLFVPLAGAVVFAMIASHIVSRTLVATLAQYLLKAKPESTGPSRNPLARSHQAFERSFEKTRHRYRDLLATLIAHRVLFIGAFIGVCVLTAVLVPLLGQDFSTSHDTGQFILHVRARSGTRLRRPHGWWICSSRPSARHRPSP